MNNNISAFYHYPLIWAVTKPDVGTIVDIGKIVFESPLDCGIHVNVSQDGLFVFDFSDVQTSLKDSLQLNNDEIYSDFDKDAVIKLNRTIIMNSFLTFMYSQVNSLNDLKVPPMVVTPSILISTPDRTANTYGSNDPAVINLLNSRYINDKRSKHLDYRYTNRHPMVITKTILDESSKNINVIVRNEPKNMLIVSDFLTGVKFYAEHNYNASVMSFWTILEQIFYIMYSSSLDDFYDVKSCKLNKNIKENLLKNKNISDVINFLLISKTIDIKTFNDITICRKARNNWIHSHMVVTHKISLLAMRIVEKMFSKTYGINLIGYKNRSL